MANVRKRIEWLERSFTRVPVPDPSDALHGLALQRLPTDDLPVLRDVVLAAAGEGAILAAQRGPRRR